VTASIESAWLLAEQSFTLAVAEGDADLPALLDSTVGPQLAQEQAVIRSIGAAGDRAIGAPTYGPVAVLSVGGGRALVRDCLRDGQIVVSDQTGEPVPGVLGQVDVGELTSTLVLEPSGWKLEDSTVQIEACDLSGAVRATGVAAVRGTEAP
jgi:hypothetical protein